MLLRLPLSLLVLLVLPFSAYIVHATGSASIPKCSFNLDTRQITCDDITCIAAEPGYFTGDLLPEGWYRISPFYKAYSEGFDLYPFSRGFYWSWHSDVPGLCCEGQFTLLDASNTPGSIYIKDYSCYYRLYYYLYQLASLPFNARECSSCKWFPDCWWDKCRCGEDTVYLKYIAFLEVTRKHQGTIGPEHVQDW